MRQIIVLTLCSFIFLALETKNPAEVRVNATMDEATRIRQLEFMRFQEINKYAKARCEQLRDIHPQNNKDLMEAELRLILSEIDLDIARIIKESN